MAQRHVEIIHPEYQPDKNWPFKQGQLIQTKFGTLYNVLRCEYDDVLGQWWVGIENHDKAATWAQAKFLQRVAFKKYETKSMLSVVGKSFCLTPA